MAVVDKFRRLSRPATPVRLADLLAFAKGHITSRTNGRRLVHEEVTLRLAHQNARMEDLGREALLRPTCLLTLESICQRLRHSIDELQSTPHAQREEPAHHLELFCRLKERHMNDLPVLARAFRNLCEVRDHDHEDAAPLDAKLDDYFTASLGLNVLIDQSVFVERDGAGRALPGIVHEACDVGDLARDAADISRELCDRALGDAPECEFEALGAGVPHVPGIPHLFHAALLEVLKNAVRATTLRAQAERVEIPPVTVRVVSGGEDVTVLIDDVGGGIARSQADRLLFGYCRSTATSPLTEGDDCGRVASECDGDVSQAQGASPLAGFGVGIPYARAQLRLFGGDLRILTVSGYGTRVACSFPRDALNLFEAIPAH